MYRNTLKYVGFPRLRGVIHKYAFYVSLVTGSILWSMAPEGKMSRAVFIYALTLSLTLAVSALYNGRPWRKMIVRRWLQRIDHTNIFLLIAASFTPFAAAAMRSHTLDLALRLVWGVALLAAAVRWIWTHPPKWVVAVSYLAVGWLCACFASPIISAIGWPIVFIVALGGFL